MSEVYKLIHPIKYFDDYISRNLRPDGREYHELRSIKLNVDSIKTAESSAIVKCGNTTVVCGIKLELATPKAEEPEHGFLITNVELPPLCSSKLRPGPPSDIAQVTSTIVSDIINNSKFVDLKDLCISRDKLAWVVYCDLICINYDGSLVDACVIALMASLKTLSLPTVSYDVETEEIKVDSDVRNRLKVQGLPVPTSFAVHNINKSNIILTDPSAYEEEMCGGIGSNLVVCCNKGLLCGTQKFGGSNLTVEAQEKAMKIAKDRTNVIEEAINVCINNYENSNVNNKKTIK